LIYQLLPDIQKIKPITTTPHHPGGASADSCAAWDRNIVLQPRKANVFTMENLWKIHGNHPQMAKIYGKSMENQWKIHGNSKLMGEIIHKWLTFYR
jgi:hypothetical protein